MLLWWVHLVLKSEADGVGDTLVGVGMTAIVGRLTLPAPDLEAAAAACKDNITRESGALAMLVA